MNKKMKLKGGDKMKDNNYVWLFAILFLAVGLSLGFGITGNVARSSTDTGSLPVADGGGGSGATSMTVTYQGVLDMFNSCNMEPKFVNQSGTCNQVCQNIQKTCVFGINSIGGYQSGKEYLESCNAGWSDQDFTMCYCCSA